MIADNNLSNYFFWKWFKENTGNVLKIYSKSWCYLNNKRKNSLKNKMLTSRLPYDNGSCLYPNLSTHAPETLEINKKSK